jgi:hypothetical protein
MSITKLLAGMGSGSAFVNGHRVIVGPNSDRIVRVVQ